MIAQAKVADSLEMLSTNGEILAGCMTCMPTVDRIVKAISNEDPHRGVNPDKVVAMGAAIKNLKRWCDGF
jgi:molecular chaperone DnaK